MQLAQVRDPAQPTASLLRLGEKAENCRTPTGYAHDRTRLLLGQGEAAFGAAKRAFAGWVEFDLGWASVRNPDAAIAVGEFVAVEVMSLGLWSLNISRITETVDTPEQFGFIYATTGRHVEQGDERFFLEFDHATGDVCYELEAVSRPRHWLARAGHPLARAYQRRFARDSARRMQRGTGGN